MTTFTSSSIKKNKHFYSTAFLFLNLLISDISVNAQHTGLKLLDLYVAPVFSEQVDTLTIKQKVVFKVVPAAEADSAVVLYGRNEGDGSILKIKAAFISNNGSFFLEYNGVRVPISAYETHLPVTLNKQLFLSANYVSVYLKDKSGNNTATLSYKLK